METTTIHPAESYLRNETNPSSLYVRIAGKRRRLFINRDRGINWHYRARQKDKRLCIHRLVKHRADILSLARAGGEYGQETHSEISETCPACHTYKFLAS